MQDFSVRGNTSNLLGEYLLGHETGFTIASVSYQFWLGPVAVTVEARTWDRDRIKFS